MKKRTNFTSIERLSLSKQIYQSIKTAIVSLDLEPGQKIKDTELAAQFNVSRTPIREALKRLEDEGLVQTTPGSLTRVSNINIEEVKQSFAVVAALHGMAAELAVSNVTDIDFQEMKKHNRDLQIAIEKKNPLLAIEADSQFHAIFLKASANVEIKKALERIMPKIHRLEFKKFDSMHSIQSVKVHHDIIHAGEKSNSSHVAKLVAKNWLSLQDQLTK